MEDVTDMMAIAEKFADHTNQFETRMVGQTRQMEVHISALEKDINELKRKSLDLLFFNNFTGHGVSVDSGTISSWRGGSSRVRRKYS